MLAARYDKWYILSAKYGLLHPKTIVESYEQTLNHMSSHQRKRWAEEVFRKLKKEISPGDSITFLAGSRYREHLFSMLQGSGFKIDVPVKGMSIGKQLQWMNCQLHARHRNIDLNRFYELLETLEEGLNGFRSMIDCNGRLEWPKAGVYFFFEPGEIREKASEALRVVRVGTHAVSAGSRSTLWGRLRSHRGALDGTGNHRGSIFRLHVGTALIARSGGALECPSWGCGQNAVSSVRKREEHLERQVSKYIGRMFLLWLSVGDQPGPASDRAYLEKNCIGLLAGHNGSPAPQSSSWLGNWSDNFFIRSSGLWNVDHVSHQYDSRFLDVLEAYVKGTIGISSAPKHSLAPKGWHSTQSTDITNQLALFED